MRKLVSDWELGTAKFDFLTPIDTLFDFNLSSSNREIYKHDAEKAR